MKKTYKYVVYPHNFELVSFFDRWPDLNFEEVHTYDYRNNEELAAEKADFLVIPGGADVSPEFYSDTRTKEVLFTKTKEQDVSEFKMMSAFIKKGKRIIGICRGAQLLCVAAGGHLIQDLRFHSNSEHDIYLVDGTEIKVNSTHHQMMCPFNLKRDEYHVIGWNKGKSNNRYIIGDLIKKSPAIPSSRKYFFEPISNQIKKKTKKLSENTGIIMPNSASSEEHLSITNVMEPEIVLFYRLGGLAIQYHPERFWNHERRFATSLMYTRAIIESFLDDKF